MSKYTFTFKKDDIFVEFTTEDKEVVERQFQIWVLNADEYVKSTERKSYKGQTVNSLNNGTPKAKTVTQPQPEAPYVSKQVEQAAAVPNPYEQHNSQAQVQMQAQPVQQNTNYAEQASSLLKTINTIQQPQMQQEQAFAQQPVQMQPQVQQYYNNQPEQQSFQQPQPQPQQPQYSEPLTNINAAQSFESVLEEKIETPTFEPRQNVDQIFLNLINSKNTKDKFHYLMITAYYLTEFGKQERFTLKQINSKLMQNVGDVIDHSMLQEAINQGFIELVPDPTGLAQVGEYRLTRQGEEFFAYRI